MYEGMQKEEEKFRKMNQSVQQDIREEKTPSNDVISLAWNQCGGQLWKVQISITPIDSYQVVITKYACTKGGEYRNRTFGKIQQSLKEIYRNNIAGKNEPSPLHISNGFINIPGTEAEGTTHGWSIINFFNTNPVVRRILVEEYQSFVREKS